MIYEYRCNKCKETVEKVVKLADYDIQFSCECGGILEKVILTPATVSLDPISGDFPGATRKWAKGREKKMEKERHNMKEHGTYT